MPMEENNIPGQENLNPSGPKIIKEEENYHTLHHATLQK